MAAPKRALPFDILDSIRGIAALYVAIAHCRGILWIGVSEFTRLYPRSAWRPLDYLAVGSSVLTRLAVEFVIVFFVLSGFSIAHSLSTSSSVRQFYKRRFIRIYPSYVVALAWAGAVYALTKHFLPQWYDGTMIDSSFIRTMQMNDFFTRSVVLNNLIYLPSQGFITPFWSLTYEVIFYLLAPLLVRHVNAYAAISLLLFLANLVAPATMMSLPLPSCVYAYLFVYGIYFAAGVVLYTYLDAALAWVGKLDKGWLVAVTTGLLLSMYAINLRLRAESAPGFVASALFSVMLILGFLKHEVRIGFLMSIGKMSYTLYITHVASVYLYLGVYWLIVKPTTHYIVSYLVWMPALPFVLAIAGLQYYLVEKHTKRVLERLRKRRAAG